MAHPIEALDPETIGSRAGEKHADQDTRALPVETLIDDESLVEKYKRMFYEEMNKPFWQNFSLNATTDFGYYTGIGQWNDEQRVKMRTAGKPALTLNYVKPVIRSLSGAERLSRYEPKAAAEQFEDEAVANVFTRLLRRTIYDANAEFVMSEGFRDGTICGVVLFEQPINYDEDPLRPKIEFATVRVPDEAIWATPWSRYDLSDTRAMWRHRWVDVDELCAHYPKKRRDILDALREMGPLLSAADASKQGAILHEGDPKDRYAHMTGLRPEDDRSFWFDEERDRVRVLETWYPRWYPTWILASDDGRRVITSTDEAKMARVYRNYLARFPGGPMTLIQRNTRKIRMCVMLPATLQVLDEGEPFQKDQSNYPFVPYFANLVRDDMYGVVRDLRDPQDEINSRRSQIAWIIRATGDGWFVDENSMVDLVKFQEESRDPKGVYVVKKGGSDPRRMPAPNVPQGLFEIIKYAINEIAHISGVKNEVIASGEDRPLSGVAISRRQQQSDVISTEYFDNFKLTKRLLYQMMARRIQEVYHDERVVRLLNEETAQDEYVTINQPVPADETPQAPGSNPSPATRFKVLNDITSLQYDIQMVETPASPSARAAALDTLLDLLQKVPAMAILFADEIIAMTDGLPNKDLLVRRVKEMQAQMNQPKDEKPKVNISLKGEVSPEAAAELSMKAAGPVQGPVDPSERMGEEAGNPQNPSGQIPTGGPNLQDRADLPA